MDLRDGSCLVNCEQVLTPQYVYDWRKRRKMEEQNNKDPCGFCGNFLQHECQLDIIRVFVGGINILVIFQIAMGLGAVYVIRRFSWWCVLDCSLPALCNFTCNSFLQNIHTSENLKYLKMNIKIPWLITQSVSSVIKY